MKFLLDTHVFIWSVTQPKKLPPTVVDLIESPNSELFLSAVSIWEIAIKLRSGRLDMEGRTAIELLDEANDMQIVLFGLDPAEAATHAHLQENTHFDPFDRMLIWQAIQRDLTLISGDRAFEGFTADGLKLRWG